MVIVMILVLALGFVACSTKTGVNKPFLGVETRNNPLFWDQQTQETVLDSSSVDHSQGIMDACAEAVKNGEATVSWGPDNTFTCSPK